MEPQMFSSFTSFTPAALVAAGTLLAATGSPATGQDAGATIRPVAAEKLPNVPGKTVTAVVVSYAPGGKSGKHHHAGSVLAYVLSGEIRSQNSATGRPRFTRPARASSSRRAASIW